MKRLFLLRHAKSSWADPDLADIDRPLNERGMDEAFFIGGHIGKIGVALDLIISSPARRAVDTANRVKDSLATDSEIACNDHIYEASPLRLLRAVSELSPNFDSVLIVGHNPGLEGFIRLLTGGIHPMPTAALADISFEIDNWAQIAAGGGKLNGIVRPPDSSQ